GAGPALARLALEAVALRVREAEVARREAALRDAVFTPLRVLRAELAVAVGIWRGLLFLARSRRAYVRICWSGGELSTEHLFVPSQRKIVTGCILSRPA